MGTAQPVCGEEEAVAERLLPITLNQTASGLASYQTMADAYDVRLACLGVDTYLMPSATLCGSSVRLARTRQRS